MLEVARDFAIKKHAGQMRKGGDPFIVHPQAVAQRLLDKGMPKVMAVVAWLHDVIEDTDATYRDLFEIGMPFYVVRHVEHMTKRDDQVYLKDYIHDVVAPCLVCNFVKEEDNAHNQSTVTEEMLVTGSLPRRWEESQKILIKVREDHHLNDRISLLLPLEHV